MIIYVRTMESFAKDAQLERTEEGLKMSWKRAE